MRGRGRGLASISTPHHCGTDEPMLAQLFTEVHSLFLLLQCILSSDKCIMIYVHQYCFIDNSDRPENNSRSATFLGFIMMNNRSLQNLFHPLRHQTLVSLIIDDICPDSEGTCVIQLSLPFLNLNYYLFLCGSCLIFFKFYLYVCMCIYIYLYTYLLICILPRETKN